MPLYEYECEACGEIFEIIQKFSDAPLATHTGCGGPVHRLMSAPALQFKGSGWYITDYAKSGGKKPEGGASASNGGSESKGEPKSGAQGESKPASTETKSSTESKPSSPGSSKKSE